MTGSRIYSVTQLNQDIKNLLESNPSFHNLFVRGEISNYKPHPSGHHYMTIKDEGAAISAVLFRSRAARLRFRPQNGMKVIARGRISSFPKSGQIQLYLADMMPEGAGALHIRFEQLKEKLYQEGLFASGHKRPLPEFPQRIALVTSPGGAAVQDMLRILARRWPLAQIVLCPALVQGAAAPESLIHALKLAERHSGADLILLGRGGGSAEDLWAFNDENLARAIYASRIPVVSAVGHEPDVTISDFVADLRAPTPSGAAELAVPDGADLLDAVDQMRSRLRTAQQRRCRQAKLHVQTLRQRLSARTPARYLAAQERAVQELQDRLQRAMRRKLEEKAAAAESLQQRMSSGMQHAIERRHARFIRCEAALDALSPLRVLSRGYAVASDPQGKVITDAAALVSGDPIRIRFSRGSADCKVQTVYKMRET